MEEGLTVQRIKGEKELSIKIGSIIITGLNVIIFLCAVFSSLLVLIVLFTEWIPDELESGVFWISLVSAPLFWFLFYPVAIRE